MAPYLTFKTSIWVIGYSHKLICHIEGLADWIDKSAKVNYFRY